MSVASDSSPLRDRGAMSGEPVRVSIGIPTYNRPRMLGQAIHSVLAQDFQDFEIIVSDDGPSGAAEVVWSFGDPRIRYFRNEPALGVPRNWNQCVRLARGQFFALLPDDDLYTSSFLAELVPVLEGSDVGFAMCGYYSVDEDLRPLHRSLLHASALTLTREAAVAKLLRTLACVPVALLFRRSAMLQRGLWCEDYWDDWAFIVTLAYHAGFTFVPKLLACNRFHRHNLSRQLGKDHRDEVLDLINQTLAVFGDALPATNRLLALRAQYNRELSHACMLKTIKALMQFRFTDASFFYARARSLYPLAGLHPGFIKLWLKHQAHSRMVQKWLRSERLSDEPLLAFANDRS